MATLVVLGGNDGTAPDFLDRVAAIARAHGVRHVFCGLSMEQLGFDKPKELGVPHPSDAKMLLLCENSPTSDLIYGGKDKAETTLNKVVQSIPNLEWIHTIVAGINRLAPYAEYDHFRRLKISNGRSAYSRSLSEYAIFAAMYFEKDIPRVLRSKAAHKWDRFVMGELWQKTVGFIGFGDIGQRTAAAMKSVSDVKVIALRRSRSNDPARDSANGLASEVYYSSETNGILEVMRNSDVVVCSLPGTEATKNIIGLTELAAMKPASIFISLGRGTVVDENALAEVLRTKLIRGAALDVFQTEPLPETSELWKLENCLVTSHNADHVPSFLDGALAVWQKNLVSWTASKSLETPVDMASGY